MKCFLTTTMDKRFLVHLDLWLMASTKECIFFSLQFRMVVNGPVGPLGEHAREKRMQLMLSGNPACAEESSGPLQHSYSKNIKNKHIQCASLDSLNMPKKRFPPIAGKL